jgi:protein-disulfide isomerase
MKQRSFWEQTVWLFGGIIVVVGFMVWLGSRGPGVLQDARDASVVEERDHRWGPEAAALTLVVYSDLQCPACALYHPAFTQLRTSHADKIRFVYRHFPLSGIHPRADLASRAAEAAHLQGKFWEMHDMIFAAQRTWSPMAEEAATEQFVGMAKKLNMNEEQFRKDILSDAVVARVRRDILVGTKAGVSGTPTFFVNGSVVSLPSNYASLRSFIDERLATTSTPAN